MNCDRGLSNFGTLKTRVRVDKARSGTLFVQTGKSRNILLSLLALVTNHVLLVSRTNRQIKLGKSTVVEYVEFSSSEGLSWQCWGS